MNLYIHFDVNLMNISEYVKTKDCRG